MNSSQGIHNPLLELNYFGLSEKFSYAVEPLNDVTFDVSSKPKPNQDWNREEFIQEKAASDNQFFEHYCRYYHDAQLCRSCYAFNIECIAFCTNCHKIMRQDAPLS